MGEFIAIVLPAVSAFCVGFLLGRSYRYEQDSEKLLEFFKTCDSCGSSNVRVKTEMDHHRKEPNHIGGAVAGGTAPLKDQTLKVAAKYPKSGHAKGNYPTHSLMNGPCMWDAMPEAYPGSGVKIGGLACPCPRCSPYS